MSLKTHVREMKCWKSTDSVPAGRTQYTVALFGPGAAVVDPIILLQVGPLPPKQTTKSRGSFQIQGKSDNQSVRSDEPARGMCREATRSDGGRVEGQERKKLRKGRGRHYTLIVIPQAGFCYVMN